MVAAFHENGFALSDAGSGNTYTFDFTNGVTLTQQLSAVNLQGGTAGGFEGAAAMVLHPTFAAPIGLAHEAACAPFVIAGPVVARIRARIAENDRRRTTGGRARLPPR